MKVLKILLFCKFENLKEMLLELKKPSKLKKFLFDIYKKLKITHDAFKGLTSLNILDMDGHKL